MKLQIACFTQAGEALAVKIEKLCKSEELFTDLETRNFSGISARKKSGDKAEAEQRTETEAERQAETEAERQSETEAERQTASTKESLSEWTERGFRNGNALLFVGACGIAVRSIAPFVKSKLTDPPVLVMDEAGRFIIPLLSCHIGGAGKLAKELAKLTGGLVVMTTASDVNNAFAVDTFAKENHLLITDMQKAKRLAAFAADGQEIRLYYPKEESGIENSLLALEQNGIKGLHKETYEGLWPKKEEGLFSEKSEERKKIHKVIISPKAPEKDLEIKCAEEEGPVLLQLVPRNIIIGAGCKKGKTAEELLSFIADTLEEQKILQEAICCIASIDKKKEEPGLVRAAERLGVSFETFSPQELSAQEGIFSASDFVEETVGVDNVCERAVFAAGAKKLLLKKQSKNGMTLAIGIGRKSRDERKR